jgi:hypothetical protein
VSADLATLPVLALNLEHGDTDHETCRTLPMAQYEDMTAPVGPYPGFAQFETDIAIMVLPEDLEAQWWGAQSSRWLRSKVHRARRLGYEFAPFEHDDHLDDIFAINTSMRERQGRKMTDNFFDRPIELGPVRSDQPCPRHREGWFGVFRDGTLYAYIHAFQIGEVTFTPNLLAHGDHLDAGIMSQLLFETTLWHRRVCGTSYVYYYYYEGGGTEGLRFFKEKMGYTPHRVQWQLSRRQYA